MTNIERKARLDIAIEILQKVHSDMCRAEFDEVSREETQELAYIINDVIRFSGKFTDK